MNKPLISGMMMVLSILILSGCGMDNDDNNGPSPTVHEKAYAVYYTVSLGTDELTYFTVSVKYKDAEGNTQTEPITASPWAKTLSSVPLPFAAEVDLVYTKTAVTITGNTSVNIGRRFDIEYQYEASSSKSIGTFTGSSSNVTWSVANYEKLRDSIVNGAYKVSYTVPK
jgi:hypothetical protein